MQYADRKEPDCRGRLRSAEDGSYSFRAVVCVQRTRVHDRPVADIAQLQAGWIPNSE